MDGKETKGVGKCAVRQVRLRPHPRHGARSMKPGLMAGGLMLLASIAFVFMFPAGYTLACLLLVLE